MQGSYKLFLQWVSVFTPQHCSMDNGHGVKFNESRISLSQTINAEEYLLFELFLQSYSMNIIVDVGVGVGGDCVDENRFNVPAVKR